MSRTLGQIFWEAAYEGMRVPTDVLGRTLGQIFWEAAWPGRPWAIEPSPDTKKRFESGAQAVINAHVSEREDLIALLAGLVREIVTDPVAADERGVMWVNRAQNALSRLVDAPDAQTPAVDTPKQVEAPTGLSEAQRDIAHECDTVRDMLLDKNRRYGNSALDPVRVFSMADPIEQIRVRIDDKLSRMASRQADDDEDVVLDLIGYLILLRVAHVAKWSKNTAVDQWDNGGRR